jgi:two-component system sensor histidine kinase DesK
VTSLRDWLRSPRLLPPNDYLGWTPYAWLVYLPVFFVQPAIEGSTVRWLLCGAGTIVFLASYFRGYWVRDRGLIPVILVQVALAVSFTPINTGAYVFFIYAASFASQMQRRNEALLWIGGVVGAGLVAAYAYDAPVYYWLGHGVFAPLIAGVNLHFAGVQRANTKLRLAQEEIEHLATVAERERIARDLHDVLGHTLSLIVLKAELASKLAERDPARAVQEIRDVEQVSRAALREVREAIRGYRPTLVDEVARARSLLDAARISADVEMGELALPREREEVIALALREAVTNVVRHSGASHAHIRVWRDGDRAMLEVTDDGRRESAAEGDGLRGMRERVELLGGAVSRAFDRGMRLTVAMPLAAPL